MANFPIVGVPSTFLVPGAFVQINFAQGVSTAGAGARSAVVVMPKLSSASGTVNTLYKIDNEAKAIEVFGAGSPGHRAIRMFLKANKRGKIYGIPYAPTSGGSAAAADGYVAFATTASARGLVKVTICGEEIEVAVSKDDTPTVIGDNVEAAINARSHLPLTASNSGGTVTLTAKVAGTSQGDGTTGVIRFRAEITSGISTTISVSGDALGLDDGTAGVEGDITESSNFADALATIESNRFYYILTSLANGTDLGELKTHIANKSDPNPGLRSVGIAAFTGSLSAGQTLATGLNHARVWLGWQLNSEHDNAELAGWLGAIHQKYHEVDTAFNFNSFRDGLIKKAYSGSDFPDADDINDALTDGLMPIASDDNGGYLVKSVTTQSKNAAGTLNDQRAAETRVVSVPDEWADTVLVRYVNRFASFKLKDDQKLPNGNVDPNQKRLRGVLTPSMAKGLLIEVLREFEAAGKLQEVNDSVESMQVGIDPSNAGRIEAQVPVHVISWANQFTMRVDEVSAG